MLINKMIENPMPITMTLNAILSRALCAAFIFATLMALAGCASTKEEYLTWDAPTLLNAAKEATDSGQYDKALKYYEQLEARYPYSIFSRQALLDQAYNYYQQQEDASALVTIERFLRLYPNQSGTDYAYYLKGLIHFGKNRGLLDFLVEAANTVRDPESSRLSYEAFQTVVSKFPQSQYATESKLKMALLFNTMAQYEVNIARYYYERGAYVAAINRAKAALVEFKQSQAQEEALVLLALSYDRLNIVPLRNDTLLIILKNYPQTTFASELASIKNN